MERKKWGKFGFFLGGGEFGVKMGKFGGNLGPNFQVKMGKFGVLGGKFWGEFGPFCFYGVKMKKFGILGVRFWGKIEEIRGFGVKMGKFGGNWGEFGFFGGQIFR